MEFLPLGFIEKITVNMTSCSKFEEAEDEGSDKQDKSHKVADKTLTVLEALPARMDWRQIFCLPDEMRQLLVAALQRPILYADKVKNVGGST